jgi:5-hydroxyisourate hydrolase-like protein (transthyretin family)
MDYKNNPRKFINKLKRIKKFSKILKKRFKKIKKKLKIKLKNKLKNKLKKNKNNKNKNNKFKFNIGKYYKSYLIKLKQYNFIRISKRLKINYLIIFYIII